MQAGPLRIMADSTHYPTDVRFYIWKQALANAIYDYLPHRKLIS